MNVFLILFGAIVASTSAIRLPTIPVVQAGSVCPYNPIYKATTRIVNGQKADEYQFPWFVSILSKKSNGLQSICGGSLISPTWVLTAAHCTHGYIMHTLSFGSNKMNSPLESLVSRSAIEHNRYNSKTLNYDISVILLPKALSYSARVQAVRLPSLSQSISNLFHQQKARACGYGRTNDASQSLSTELMWVEKRIISNAQCTQTYGPKIVLPSTMCTLGWYYDKQSTCNGDSGGPLVIDEGGIFTQIGIVSFVSNQGCESGHPAGYIRTASFLNWISTQTGIGVRL